MKNTESTSSVNLFPIIALLVANLIAVCIGLFMLVGLHRKVPSAPTSGDAILSADRIGEIKLDRDKVRINLMKFDSGGTIQKAQEFSLPLKDGYLAGLERMQTFVDKMVEEGIIEKTE